MRSMKYATDKFTTLPKSDENSTSVTGIGPLHCGIPGESNDL